MKIVGTIQANRFDELYGYLTDSGSANAYAVSFTPAVDAYTAGLRVVFKAANGNTGASTLAVNGMSTKSIKKSVSSDLASGDIVTGQIVVVVYDGTNFQLVGGPGGGGAGSTGYTGYTGYTGPSGAGSTGYTGYTGSTGPSSYDKAITVDGGGAVVTSGVKGRTNIPVSGTISKVKLLADVSGSVTFDIKKSTFANFPGSLTSIVGSNAPALSSAQKADITLDGGWTTAVTAGDVLEFSITGTPTTITQITLIVTITT